MDKNRKKPKIRYAAALRYREEIDNAPRIVAFGKGELAEKIIQTARENNIPLHEDPELVQALSSLEIGREIPVELYQAIAEVLAFVLYLDKKGGSRQEEVARE
ncbi:MAG: hypothetical protein GX989_01590 [Firmicutes bacterium]|nr:hypothetical protein [Bacillota bacterium]